MTEASPDALSDVLQDEMLARAVSASVDAALRSPRFHAAEGLTTQVVVENAVRAASRDIELHPVGRLFKRLIEFGPREPDDDGDLPKDSHAVSDQELGRCVEFVYSVMVNRFKGELAELFALEPTLHLAERLVAEGKIAGDSRLEWGWSIRQRSDDGSGERWSASYRQGADGLLLARRESRLLVEGVVEVKSMARKARALVQLEDHVRRLGGGLRLDGETFAPADIQVSPRVARILIRPSTWPVERAYTVESTAVGTRRLRPVAPWNGAHDTAVTRWSETFWDIRLGWSEEALRRSAFAMALWYVGTIGTALYAAEQAGTTYAAHDRGRDRMCHWLYFAMLRPLTRRQLHRAEWLYNVFSFGFEVGGGVREMMWDPTEGPAARLEG